MLTTPAKSCLKLCLKSVSLSKPLELDSQQALGTISKIYNTLLRDESATEYLKLA